MYLKNFAYPVLVASIALVSQAALAFDIKESVQEKTSPFEVFRSGFSAYKSGNKDEAIKALRYAAEQGHAGANWKLARMYADGDGVDENDFEAYKMFERVVHDGAEPGSQNESFVSDALVSLAGYVRKGIPGSPVKADARYARELYLQAASNFGDADAQFELGKMLLEGEGGETNAVQAARWFQLAAKKGHSRAQAMLGNMLFQAGKTVRGLALLTVAFERCVPVDCQWIRALQEEAFSLSGEADRRNAVALAGDMVRETGSLSFSQR